MRDDPIAGEEAILIVTGVDDSSDSMAELGDAIESVGGDVTDELEFNALRVRIPETAVEALCNLDGIESIETANTLGVGGDAGEDVGE